MEGFWKKKPIKLHTIIIKIKEKKIESSKNSKINRKRDRDLTFKSIAFNVGRNAGIVKWLFAKKEKRIIKWLKTFLYHGIFAKFQ